MNNIKCLVYSNVISTVNYEDLAFFFIYMRVHFIYFLLGKMYYHDFSVL